MTAYDGDREQLFDQLLDRCRAADQEAPDSELAELAQVLAAASAPAAPGPQPGELDALEAFRTLVPSADRPARNRFAARSTVRIASIATTGLVVLGSGAAAAAATGSLPGAAQQTAKHVLAAIGVHVPGPNPASGTHRDQRGRSGDAPGPAGTDVAGTPGSTGPTGDSHGAAVSSTASDGHSQAGTHSRDLTPGPRVAASQVPSPGNDDAHSRRDDHPTGSPTSRPMPMPSISGHAQDSRGHGH